MNDYRHMSKGQSLVEVLLALGVFTLGASAVAYLLLVAQSSSRQRLEHVQGVLLCEEGIELSSVIASSDFALLREGTHSISLQSGMPTLDGDTGTVGIFTRTLTVEDVSSTTKKVTAQVSWNFSPVQDNSVEFTRMMSNWKQ